MSNDIKLSPKYGVNPTIPVCFWCGKEKNEIALLGRISGKSRREDIEAPRHMVLDYEPCDECKKNRQLGVTVIEATETPNTEGQPPIDKYDHFPTGRYCVLKTEAADRIFSEYAPWEAGKCVLVDKEVYSMFVQD